MNEVGLTTAALSSEVALDAVADTLLVDWSSVTNYGALDEIRIAGVAFDAGELSIVRFDPDAITATVGGATLESATLELTISSVCWDWGNNKVAAHRMNHSWTESGATWLCADDTDHGFFGKHSNDCAFQDRWGIEQWNFYPLPYEDVPTSTASLSWGQTGTVSLDVTGDVQAVLDGAPHDGWLISPETGFSSLWAKFDSRESSNPPRLVIQTIDGGPEPEPSAPPKTTCVGSSGLQPGAPWPMRGQCPQRRHGTRFVGTQDSTLNWTAYLSGDVRSSPAIAADGTVVVGSDSGYLFAINPDGSTKWSFRTWGDIRSSPAIGADGVVFVGSRDDHVYAVDIETGTELWDFDTNSRVDSSPSVGPDGTVYIGSDNGRLYALDGVTGQELWNYQTGGDINSSPTVGPDGAIFIGSDDNHLYALSTEAGLADSDRLLWKVDLGSNVRAIPAIGAGPEYTIYVGNTSDVLFKIAREDGAVIWTYGGSFGDVDSSVAIGPDGSIVFGGDGNRVFALNENGSLKWAKSLGGDIHSTAAIGANGVVYIGSDDNYIYALNPSDGSILWSKATGGNVRSSPAIGADGAIYVGSDNNKLYSIGEFQCGSTTPCQNGTGPCTSDGDCAQPLVCGQGIASRFGLPSDFGVCWDPDGCGRSFDCGHFSSPCGSCCVPSCLSSGDPDGCGGICQLCVGGVDTDLDGLSDCDELSDGSRWTNPAVFNGLLGHLGPQCHSAPSCDAIDEISKIATCDFELDEQLLASGWDFSTSDTNSCDPGFGFDQPFAECIDGFSVAYEGYVLLEKTGTHCFEVVDPGDSDCGVVHLFDPPYSLQSGMGPLCIEAAASTYPITIFYETAGSGTSQLSVKHCYDTAAPCTPTETLPPEMLLPSTVPVSELCPPGTPSSDLCPGGQGSSCTNNNECINGFACDSGLCSLFGCDNPDHPAFDCGPGSYCKLPCPACSTTPSCADRSCGTDGCYGSCGEFCNEREAGCETNADCREGNYCEHGAGARLGVDVSLGVCLPNDCDSFDPAVNPCRDPSNQGLQTDCGVCPDIEAECGWRVCGQDAAGNSCGPTPPDSFCVGGALVAAISLEVDPVVTTDAVGVVAGSFGVDRNGGAQYSIPIPLPPGRGGMTPSVGLTYSSGSGNGQLGAGWRLSATHSITRCNKTLATDGTSDSPHLTPDDAFCLGGRRLIKTSTGFPLADSFRLELDDFSEITGYYDSDSGDEVEGFIRFEQITHDGRKLVFGGREDSRILVSSKPSERRVASWALSEVRDRNENGMEYRYSHDERSVEVLNPGGASEVELVAHAHRLSTIIYAVHPTDPKPQHVVVFNYESRPDVRNLWRYGARIDLDRRLSSIVIGEGGNAEDPLSPIGPTNHGVPTQVREFKLSYAPIPSGAASSQVSRLEKVTECVGDDIFAPRDTCKQPTTFAYEGALVFENVTAEEDDSSAWGLTATLDFNGDGRDDLYMTRGGPSPAAMIRVSTSDPQQESLTFLDVELPNGWTPSYLHHYPTSVQSMDFDMDGEQEIVALRDAYWVDTSDDSVEWHPRCIGQETTTKAYGNRRTGIVVKILHDGNDVVGTQVTHLCLPTRLQGLSMGRYVVDVDGDSRQDIVDCTPAGGSSVWEYYRLSESGFTGPFPISGLEERACPSHEKQTPRLSRKFETYPERAGREHFRIIPGTYAVQIDSDPSGELQVYGQISPNHARPGEPGFLGLSERIFLSFIDFVVSPNGDSAAATEVPSTVPWDSRRIDINGDGLTDYYRLSQCKRFQDKGGLCQEFGPPRMDIYLNTGAGFTRQAGVEAPDYDWVLAIYKYNLAEPPDDTDDTKSCVSIATNLETAQSNAFDFLKEFCLELTWEIKAYAAGDVPTQVEPYMVVADTLRMAFELSRPIDADGDGLQDLLIPLPEFGWTVLRSTGENLSTQRLSVGGIPWDPLNFPEPSELDSSYHNSMKRLISYIDRYGRESPTIADVNGDAHPDILLRVIEPGRGALLADHYQAPSYWRMVPGTGAGRVHLTSVTDGFGERVDIEYKPLTDPDVYSHSTAGCTYPMSCVQPRHPVVSKQTTGHCNNSDPASCVATAKLSTHYTYTDARRDLHGRGYLGFEELETVVVPETGLAGYESGTHLTFDFERDAQTGLYPRLGAPMFSTSSAVGGGGLRQTLTETDYGILRPNPKTLHPFVRRTRKHVFDGQTSEMISDLSTVTVVDNYGNPQLITQGVEVESGYEIDAILVDTDIFMSTETDVGVRLTAFDYHYDSPSGAAYDKAGFRSLPSDTLSAFVQGQLHSPRGQSISHARATALGYDLRGNLTSSIREPSAAEADGPFRRGEVFYRDDYGNLTQKTLIVPNETSRITHIAYDSRGYFPVELSPPNLFPTKVIYDSRYGTLYRSEDYNGLVSIEARDGFGRIAVRIDPDTTKTETTYAYLGLSSPTPLEIHERRDKGAELYTRLDAYKRPAQTLSRGVRGQWLQSDIEYDALDRTIRQTLPHSPLSTEEYAEEIYKYDVLGRVTKKSWLDQEGASYVTREENSCYSGNTSCTQNARGFTSCQVSDQIGRVIEAYDPEEIVTYPTCAAAMTALSARSPTTKYGYGEVLERIERKPQSTSSSPIVTAIMPDRYGRRRFLMDPDTGKSEFVYNGFDEVIREHDANGREIRYDHDEMGRVVGRTDVGMFSDDTDGVTLWFFDGLGPSDVTLDAGELAGALSRTVSPDGHEKIYTYYNASDPSAENAGHLRRVTQTLADNSAAPSQTYEMDFLAYDGGRATEIRYPDNGMGVPIQVRQVFDSYGNLTSIEDALDASASPFWTLDETDDFGRIQRETFGNGAVSTYTRDNRQRLRQVVDVHGGAPLRSATYEYDANDNLRTRSVGSQTETFPSYDHLDRLRKSVVSGPSPTGPTERETDYDLLGNIVSRSGVGDYGYLPFNDTTDGFEEAELPGHPDFLLPVAMPHAVYSAGDVFFGYDGVGNRTIRLDTNETDGFTHYTYTPFNKPSAMWRGNTDIGSGTDIVGFEYDADESRVRKVATDNASSSASITTYMEGTYERRLDPSDDVHIYYLGNGSRVIGQLEVSLSDSDYAATYFHVDHLGSPELMTDDDGVVGSGHRSFSAFGEARDPDDWTVLISPPTVDRNIGYTGHQATDAYGLVDMRGRQYDPGIGAFTTADPFVPDPSLSQSFNRYAYVRNNPLRLVDPSGFQDIPQTMTCTGSGCIITAYPNSAPEPMISTGIFVEDPSNVPQGEDGTGTDGRFLAFGMGLGMGIDGNQAQKGTAETNVRHELIANLPYTLAGNLLGGGLGVVAGKLLGPLLSRSAGGLSALRKTVIAASKRAASRGAKEAIGATGKLGEAALKKLGGQSQVFFRTSRGGRYIDQLVRGVAHESKVGYTPLTKAAKQQIAKDVELIGLREIQGATWHFFRSPVTGLRGPSKPLFQALEQAGIGIVNH